MALLASKTARRYGENMIAETIPALKNLSPEQKVLFAAELWRDAIGDQDETPDPKLVETIRERLAYCKEHPDEVSTWEDVRARLLSGKQPAKAVLPPK